MATHSASSSANTGPNAQACISARHCARRSAIRSSEHACGCSPSSSVLASSESQGARTRATHDGQRSTSHCSARHDVDAAGTASACFRCRCRSRWRSVRKALPQSAHFQWAALSRRLATSCAASWSFRGCSGHERASSPPPAERATSSTRVATMARASREEGREHGTFSSRGVCWAGMLCVSSKRRRSGVTRRAGR